MMSENEVLIFTLVFLPALLALVSQLIIVVIESRWSRNSSELPLSFFLRCRFTDVKLGMVMFSVVSAAIGGSLFVADLDKYLKSGQIGFYSWFGFFMFLAAFAADYMRAFWGHPISSWEIENGDYFEILSKQTWNNRISFYSIVLVICFLSFFSIWYNS